MAIANDTCKPAAETLPEQVNTQRESFFPFVRSGGLPRHLSRLYRAHVEPAENSTIRERTVFVEAAGHRDAIRKICAVVATLEGCLAESVLGSRIYNCASARELIDEGLSADIELRLFETGWCGNDAVSFVQEPLFLLAAPAGLIRKWVQISGVSHG
jgi:hypothetical protein